MIEIVSSKLTCIAERWRLEAEGHYCQTYNRGRAEGLEAAADELMAFVMVNDWDEVTDLADLNARLAKLERVVRGLVEYRKHNTLNFQLEKADTWINEMRNIVEEE